MYCSTCGVAVAQSLSYCNYCGAKLNGVKGDDSARSPEVRPELLVSAMVGLFILGLVAITMLSGVMKAVLNLNAPQIIPFMVLSFLIMMVLEGLFIRLLFRRKRGSQEGGDKVLRSQATSELDAAQARVLLQPVSSVTEHTTRAFDPVYSQRKSD